MGRQRDLEATFQRAPGHSDPVEVPVGTFRLLVVRCLDHQVQADVGQTGCGSGRRQRLDRDDGAGQTGRRRQARSSSPPDPMRVLPAGQRPAPSSLYGSVGMVLAGPTSTGSTGSGALADRPAVHEQRHDHCHDAEGLPFHGGYLTVRSPCHGLDALTGNGRRQGSCRRRGTPPPRRAHSGSCASRVRPRHTDRRDAVRP